MGLNTKCDVHGSAHPDFMCPDKSKGRKWAMLCRLKVRAFNDPGWRWERKLDGCRMRVYIYQDRTVLTARSGADKTDQFPELRFRLPTHVNSCALDGEVVSAHGLSFQDFNQRRMNRQDNVEESAKEMPAVFVAFDILAKDNDEVWRLPFVERRKILEDTLPASMDLGPVRVPVQFAGGVALFRAAVANGWEGVVGKRLDQPYMPGKRAWFKVKVWQEDVFGVSGWDDGKGRRAGMAGSFYLEDPRDGRYVGKVGTGFSAAELARLTELVRTSEEPVWFRVKFVERTNSGMLRFPVYLGLAPTRGPTARIQALRTDGE